MKTDGSWCRYNSNTLVGGSVFSQHLPMLAIIYKSRRVEKVEKSLKGSLRKEKGKEGNKEFVAFRT